MVCLLDTIDFPQVFLGAIKAGFVPIAVNTLLTTSDFEFHAAATAAPLSWLIGPIRCCPCSIRILPTKPFLKHVAVSGCERIESSPAGRT
jgi:benzoate-CoA ligase